ncbi:NAD(P)H-dependent oxidoreductase [Gillisia limnaea]|uniref:Nitroreductase n=1 Tax=Gillisia limnaea (strain DSM 15749 / LMG 21470 / R-8282) TaxID=865937 RepID=H2BZP8_GILLR|nr:NAD(P)H-dependent oxidoreductase [Gillisia limnaea]EHQ03457.1 nitroreductase [Gillisia limnaea DSM 15749]
MKNYIETLNWRYATKIFDTSKKVSEEDLEELLEAIQLSASSYGLQPYEIFVIKNAELRNKLQSAAFDQPQITDASHLLVFANLAEIDKSYVDGYLDNIAKTRTTKRKDLAGLEEMLDNTVLKFSPEEKNQWAANQTYIALGNLLSAAANFKIDACPMEGFEADKFDEILGLKEKGLTTAVVATIGYRSEEDQLQHAVKVRKSKEELFNRL